MTPCKVSGIIIHSYLEFVLLYSLNTMTYFVFIESLIQSIILRSFDHHGRKSDYIFFFKF